MKKYISMAGALVLLAAIGLAVFLFFQPVPATPSPPPTPLPSPSPTVIPNVMPITQVLALSQGTDGYPWWNDTVFYEIFVRSFCDSNGDGIGDFNGITGKLDYLKDMGVTGLWLMPINPSPSYHGYDVTNYLAVNPDYGTIADFKTLVSKAHNRGIRVIIDMVLNHTSSQHPWFIAAQDPNSPYRNYYIWSDTKPVYSGPWGEQVWYPTTTGYYYAIFSKSMPDLNFRNAEVTAQMENAVKFWLETTGIDGFRLDAARHLIEDGTVQANTPETHAWFQQFRTFFKGINPMVVTIGELAGEHPVTMASYTQGDQLDLAFDFGLASAFVSSASQGNAGTALQREKISNSFIPPFKFAPFLTNHDQNRLMTQLNNDPNKVKIAASMLLTSPGVPFIYYGEEVGLEGQKPDEDIRRPMQWSAEKYSGFSTTIPWESVGPDWETNNVAAETNDPNSILSHYRALIQIRNEHAALRVGNLIAVHSDQSALYTILRVSKAEMVMVIINLSGAPVRGYKLSLDKSNIPAGGYQVFPILSVPAEYSDLIITDIGGFSNYLPLPEIPSYGTVIIQLQLSK